jgi:CheY-like chemotaxis protein
MEHAASDRSRREARRPRVILAEDDPDVRDGIAYLLRRGGFDVTTAASGTDLVEKLALRVLTDGDGRSADVIITDVRMPGFNGLSVVEGLRAAGWEQPVIVITAFADAAIRERVRRLPSTELLAKPFEPEALEAAVTFAVPIR